MLPPSPQITNPLTLAIDINGTWRLTIFWGLIFCALLLVRKVLAQIGWVATLFLGYAFVFALYITEYPNLPYGAYNKIFQTTAGQALFELSFITLTLFMVRKKWLWVLIPPLLVAIEIPLLWIQKYGIMIAPSFDTALLALCIPFVEWWLVVPAVITILFHHGSTALMMLATYALILGLRTKTYRIVTYLALPVCAAAAYFHSHGPWLDGLERLRVWGHYMERWAGWGGSIGNVYGHHWGVLKVALESCDWKTIFLGAGPGSFMWFSLMIDNYKPPMFLHMHSDWLQILFELGVVGLVLALGTFGVALKKAWRDTPLLMGVVGTAAFALTYHPLRFFPSAFLVAMIFAKALTKRES